MGQFFFEKEPNAIATFEFQNRSHDRLADHLNIDALRNRFSEIRDRGISASELRFLGEMTMPNGEFLFTDDYLDYLKTKKLPEIEVELGGKHDDIQIRPSGEWSITSLWETIVMREVSEQYNRGLMSDSGLSKQFVEKEGYRRLKETIDLVRAHPEIKIMEFGTRRAAFAYWHRAVLDELIDKCPHNITGTSNVGFSARYGGMPQGTIAHEAIMGFAALADARKQNIADSVQAFNHSWYERYGDAYAIFLPDTFTTKSFLKQLTTEQLEQWRGLRQDSGDDPIVIQNMYLDRLTKAGVDPTGKLFIPSNGLNVREAINIYEKADRRLRLSFGIGTYLTANTALPPRNHVVKATRFEDPLSGQSAGAVKLSDDPFKHSGTPANVDRYYRLLAA
jgi:nicotinate phosphoribosyltransferase